MFSYIYFRTYTLYLKWGEKDIPGLYALAIVSLFQGVNCLTIYWFLTDVLNYDLGFTLENHLIITSSAIIIFVNLICYRISPFKKLETRWGNESKRKAAIKGKLIVAYFLFSILVMFLMAMFVRAKKVKSNDLQSSALYQKRS